MLCKNEADNLARTLPIWSNVIDAWIIGLDDANSDTSRQIIEQYLGHLPGKIVDVHFVDMGTTWGELVEYGIQYYGEYTHGIMADADFMPISKLDKNELRMDVWKHTVKIYTQGTDATREVDWVYRNVEGVKVKRRTHQIIEVPLLPQQKQEDVITPMLNWILEEKPGGYQDRSGVKHERYLKFLEDDLKDYPGDIRTMFYLGNAHYELALMNIQNLAPKHHDHLDAALELFDQVFHMEKSERAWHARLRSAEIVIRFYKNWKRAENFYLDCIKNDPARVEPYIYIGNHYRQSVKTEKDIERAKKYLWKAATLLTPDRTLFMNYYMYKCLGKLELGRLMEVYPTIFTKQEKRRLLEMFAKVLNFICGFCIAGRL